MPIRFITGRVRTTKAGWFYLILLPFGLENLTALETAQTRARKIHIFQDFQSQQVIMYQKFIVKL
jgi:hypothetical protein